MKQFGVIWFVVACLVYFSQNAQAQKIIKEPELSWVLEAQSELDRALSDPGLSEQERLAIVNRSAKTLKEYGQPYAYPEGEIPLRKTMEENFEQCENQIIELSDWSLNLTNKSLDQKMKLINTLQISVVEEQVKLLLPGSTPVMLSKDVVNTVFDWNIAEGFNGGQQSDARGLAERFKILAERNQLVKQINVLIYDQRQSLRLLDRDRKQLDFLETKLKKAYNYAEASTHTIAGYEGAQLGSPGGVGPTSSGHAAETKTSSMPSNIMVGTWKFGFSQTGYFYWTFKNDGTFVFDDKMNEGNNVETGKYSVSGNVLTLYGPKSQCEDIKGVYTLKMDIDQFEFRNISDGCMSRQLTLNHVWRK